MYFVPVLFQNGEPHPIWLPLPIQSETFPSQTPWPWGTEPRNVACPSCSRASEYSESNSHWEQLPFHQADAITKMAIHLLVVPCGIEQCAGLIEILVIAKRGILPPERNGIVRSLNALGVVCGNGHRTTFLVASKPFQAFREIE
jgi:hypothetical protein